MTNAHLKTALAIALAGGAIAAASQQKRASTGQLMMIVGFALAQWVATSAQLEYRRTNGFREES